MDPQDLLSVEFRIVLYILYHEPDQVKELLRSDEQMHPHHHIEMADELTRIIPLTLELEEAHQLFSRLIFDAYCPFEFFFVKRFSESSPEL